VHDDKQVTSLHSHNNCLDELRSSTLGVVLLGHDEVEELATASGLHENMHEECILVAARMLGEVVHDLDLASRCQVSPQSSQHI
jgi:hypothetical protein